MAAFRFGRRAPTPAFPDDQEDIEESPTKEFPMEFSLQEFFRFSYRVKSWKVTASGAWNVTFNREIDGIVNDLNTIGSFSVEMLVRDALANEVSPCTIVRSAGSYSPITAIGTATTVDAIVPGTPVIENVFGNSSLLWCLPVSGDKWWRGFSEEFIPSFRLTVSAAVSGSYGYGLYADSWSSVEDFPSSFATDYSFDAGFVEPTVGTVTDISYTTRSMSIEVEPYQYFTYDHDDGLGPRVDEDTGEMTPAHEFYV